jgi:MFS family permease
VLADTATPLWLAAPIWALAGSGMGLAMPSVSALTLRLSPGGEQGANSAALQLTDVIGSVLAIAAGATIINLTPPQHFPTAVVVIDTALDVVALTGALASRRAQHAARL